MAQVRKYSDVTRSLERVESIHADFVQHVEIAAKQLRPGCSDARITLQDNLFDGRPAEIVIGIRSELHRRIHRRDERSRRWIRRCNSERIPITISAGRPSNRLSCRVIRASEQPGRSCFAAISTCCTKSAWMLSTRSKDRVTSLYFLTCA